MSSVARVRHLRRALAERLERLRETLEELLGRVHEAVAQAVSQAVAAAVREVLLAVLRAATNLPGLPPMPRRPPEGYHATWPERREPSYGDGAYTDPSAGWWTDDEAEGEAAELLPAGSAESTPSRWWCALSLGCQASAWWLRRGLGRRPLLAAVGIGAACAAAAVAVGAGLAHATLRWVALAGALRSGVWVLSLAGNV
jgi:hypothetical protein